jgi:hypothetical protein
MVTRACPRNATRLRATDQGPGGPVSETLSPWQDLGYRQNNVIHIIQIKECQAYCARDCRESIGIRRSHKRSGGESEPPPAHRRGLRRWTGAPFTRPGRVSVQLRARGSAIYRSPWPVSLGLPMVRARGCDCDAGPVRATPRDAEGGDAVGNAHISGNGRLLGSMSPSRPEGRRSRQQSCNDDCPSKRDVEVRAPMRLCYKTGREYSVPS